MKVIRSTQKYRCNKKPTNFLAAIPCHLALLAEANEKPLMATPTASVGNEFKPTQYRQPFELLTFREIMLIIPFSQ